ncbi:linker for activation of T-cells family member 2 isoform X4 [Symphalangus syndactylus]|uniref:linker for activation of T-cells family member 2 isoform X4 n=1 Tax=Symphalangus syndactylus TaxID=9590 RepID=UPI003003F4A9
MSSGTELLWPGAALLVLLGVAASLCVRCSRPGAKRSEKIYQQRSLREDQQSFTGSRTYSLVGQAWPGPLADMALTRKDKLLQFSPSLEGEWHRAGTGLAKLGLRQAKTPCDRCRAVGAAGPDPASSRYQNFSKGSRHGSEEAYIDPIAMEHYNWGRFSKLPEDDDANSYENVLICKQKTRKTGAQQEGIGGLCRGDHSLSLALKTGPISGLCPSASPEEDEESEDYQNSASIHQWRESRKVMGQLQKEASPGPVGSPDEEEDGEPDYVNGEVAATEA